MIPEGIPYIIIKGKSILKVNEIDINIEKNNKHTLLYTILNSPKRNK